jgi:hypothetical protein
MHQRPKLPSSMIAPSLLAIASAMAIFGRMLNRTVENGGRMAFNCDFHRIHLKN